jgi:hypothetical protein
MDETDPFLDDFDIPAFDEPIADPAIREAYQNALGRFMVAHNEVDFWMSGILEKAVKALDPDGGLNGLALGDFSARATKLALLMKTAPHLALGGVGIGRLHELNGTRNILAHSHFDQDPWDGTYEIVKARHRNLTEKRLNNLNADTINAQAKELEEIAAHMSAVFDFIDHPVPVEYLKDYPIVLKSRELWDIMMAEREKAANSQVSAEGSEGPAASTGRISTTSPQDGLQENSRTRQ